VLNCPHAKFFHQAEETMNGQEIRDRLLHSYERSYDIVKPSEVNGHTYDACASYRALKESRAVEDQLS
jgi:glutathione peroxidase-family protein